MGYGHDPERPAAGQAPPISPGGPTPAPANPYMPWAHASNAPAPKRRWPYFWVGLTAVLIVGGFVAGALLFRSNREADPLPPATMEIKGTVHLVGIHPEFTPTVCDGTNILGTRTGYDDLIAGAPVVVTDAAGMTVAIGKLGAGVPDIRPELNQYLKVCTMRFTVTEVPAGRGFYGVQIASRDLVQYPEQRLAEPLTLTIGP